MCRGGGAHHAQKDIHIDRLADVLHRMGADVGLQPLPAGRCNQYRPDIRPPAGHNRDELQAVHSRQIQIDQHNLGIAPLEHVQSLLGGPSSGGIVTTCPQKSCERSTGSCLIFNYENSSLHVQCLGFHAYRRHGRQVIKVGAIERSPCHERKSFSDCCLRTNRVPRWVFGLETTPPSFVKEFTMERFGRKRHIRTRLHRTICSELT